MSDTTWEAFMSKAYKRGYHAGKKDLTIAMLALKQAEKECKAKDAEIERLRKVLTSVAAMHDRRYDTGEGGSWSEVAYDMRSVAAQAATEGGEG